IYKPGSSCDIDDVSTSLPKQKLERTLQVEQIDLVTLPLPDNACDVSGYGFTLADQCEFDLGPSGFLCQLEISFCPQRSGQKLTVDFRYKGGFYTQPP